MEVIRCCMVTRNTKSPAALASVTDQRPGHSLRFYRSVFATVLVDYQGCGHGFVDVRIVVFDNGHPLDRAGRHRRIL